MHISRSLSNYSEVNHENLSNPMEKTKMKTVTYLISTLKSKTYYK